MKNVKHLQWENPINLQGINYICGHCGSKVAPSKGYVSKQDNSPDRNQMHILICSNCNRATFAILNSQDKSIYEQYPSPMYGETVEHLSDEIESLYIEARRTTSVGAYTSTVLTCRKILMHVAVDKGAGENLRFVQYVEYLAENNYIPEGSKNWVDYIRNRSNEANHEIEIMTPEDAEILISLTEMLLKIIYDYPSKVKKTLPAKSESEPNTT